MGGFLDLSPDPDEPFQRIPGGLRAGRNGLVEYLQQAQTVGFSHAALNAKVSRQPYVEVLEELADYVLPHFPSHEHNYYVLHHTNSLVTGAWRYNNKVTGR